MQNVFIQWITKPVRYGMRWYLSKPRNFRFSDISITILPGVFHPGFFHSTKMILEFMNRQDLAGKKFLELGCGSGIIAIQAARKGAFTTASDISTKAVENVIMNAQRNQVVVKVFNSDLFDSIPETKFDWIVINPPYYPSDPKSEAEYAWYCGKDHQYFQKLLKGLPAFIHEKSRVLIILSEVCDLQRIFSLVKLNSLILDRISEKKVWVDGRNFLYWIKKVQ